MGFEKLIKGYTKARNMNNPGSLQNYEEEIGTLNVPPEELDQHMMEVLDTDTSFRIEDPSERARRAGISKQMRDAMLHLCKVETNPEYEKTYLSQNWRGYPLIMEIDEGDELTPNNAEFLSGVGAGRTDENGKAKEELRDHVFQRLVTLSEAYDTETIDKMSDQELAEEAMMVNRYLRVIGEIQHLSEANNDFLNFTDEQMKKLREIAQEKGGANVRQTKRMDVIANPYYAEIDTGKLEKYELNQINFLLDTEEDGVSADLISDVSGLENGKCNEWSEKIRKDLTEMGISMDDVSSVTLSSGAGATKNDAKNLGSLVNKNTFALVTGKDGKEVAVFRGEEQRQARYGTAAEFLNRRATRRINRLSKQIKAVDPWYLRSSKEYKEMKAGMEELASGFKKLSDPLNQDEMRAMRERYSKLQEKSQAYLTAKMKQRGAESINKLVGNSQRERDRVSTAKALDKFLKEQIAELDRRIVPEKVKQEEKQVPSAADGKQKKEVTGDIRIKAVDRLLEYKKLATEQRGLDPKETNYNKFCDSVIAAVDGMQAYIVGEPTDIDKVRGYMQDLTLFNMVRMERVVTKEKPGVIEGVIRDSSHSSVLNTPGMRNKIYNGIFKQTRNSLKRDALTKLFAEGRERRISMDVLGIDKDVLQEQAPAPAKNIEKEKRFEEKSIGGI